MCNKGSPAISSPGLKPTRKTRTKTRKPKYFSLKLEISTKKKKEANPQESTNPKMPHKQQLINLFPLHPENNLVISQDRSSDMQDDQMDAAFLFQTASDDTSTTLEDVLDTNTAAAAATITTRTTSEEDPLAPSPIYPSRTCDVRTAMRCKERDASAEMWASYCKVVKREQEEESSSCAGRSGGYGGGLAYRKMMQVHDWGPKRLVGLKLDYQEVLNAWSDKGPLYFKGESPQTVPDLRDASNAQIDGLGCLGNLWRVPEMDEVKVAERVEAKDGRKTGQREASVLRYKEKRQSRLFSKRIRVDL
uniref:Uncharacterized protein LOC8260335 isoform X2 n=1 Tax=Rhizophora mucronata TaxID=61149 RepID=A0A2P2JX61_RHIMU